ncbi:unnamed protein product [Closterium sp. Naga37s-1]|nr:unnamed protein product [Closterium sp. Naga37s-1]
MEALGSRLHSDFRLSPTSLTPYPPSALPSFLLTPLPASPPILAHPTSPSPTMPPLPPHSHLIPHSIHPAFPPFFQSFPHISPHSPLVSPIHSSHTSLIPTPSTSNHLLFPLCSPIISLHAPPSPTPHLPPPPNLSLLCSRPTHPSTP